MITDDAHLIFSKFSSHGKVDGLNVDVRIYRLDFYPVWALEVITEDGKSLVWEELFATDSEAFATFQMAAQKGMPFFIRHAGVETLH